MSLAQPLVERLRIFRNLVLIAQLQPIEPPFFRSAVGHAEIEVPAPAVAQNEQGNPVVRCIAEELRFGSGIQGIAPLGFDEHLRAAMQSSA